MEQKCWPEPQQVCESVAVEVEREKCITVPREHCRQVDRKHCSPVPSQQCRQVEVEQCAQVPVEHCLQVHHCPLGSLQGGTVLRCRWSGAATSRASSARTFPGWSALRSDTLF